MREHPAVSKLEALMQAAWLLQVRLAFKHVNTERGPRYLRIDKIE